MHRALATVAVFKLIIALVIFIATVNLDAVLLVSCILMAVAAAIIRSVQEGEVALVLVSLILLIDAIGFFLSMASAAVLQIVAYTFLLAWDVQIIMLFRQLET
ncbi:hypothetical protein [Pyrobaculum neutrophilum]|nr:hypothetical protein [Pyrobaculum neutrophilum]